MNDQIFEVNCGFFDSVNKDRLYSADEMNRPYKRVITNDVFATPQGSPSTDLQVLTANDGMNIIVKKGEGLFADKWFENPADIAITVPTNTSTGALTWRGLIGEDTSVASDSSITIDAILETPFDYMQDEACDKFYWKRTARR